MKVLPLWAAGGMRQCTSSRMTVTKALPSCYLVDERERSVDAEVLQPLVAEQRLVGHEQRVELGPVRRLRRVLDVLQKV